jgi:hypothetical protein
LNELNSASEVVDHFLHSFTRPMLCCVIRFAARNHQPILAADRVDGSLPIRQIDVTFRAHWLDRSAKLLREVHRERGREMPWLAVASVDQRIVHLDRLNVRIVVVQRCEVFVEIEDAVARRSDIGLVFAWIVQVKIANCASHHHDVAWSLKVGEHQLTHS